MSTTVYNSIEIAQRTSTTPPKHRAEGRKNLVAKVLVAGLVLSVISLVPQFTKQVPGALASVAADSIALYLSAPMVQGPTATGSNVFIETFDTVYTDTGARLHCPTSSTVYSVIEQSTAVGANSNDAACGVYNPYFHPWGGARTTSSTPNFNLDLDPSQVMTSYGQVHGHASFTLTLTRAAKYVGFWWTSGGNGNRVKFFDQNDVLIATFETSEIVTKLDTPPVVSILDNSTYTKDYYLGHPAGHVSNQPTITSVRPSSVTQTANWDTGGLFSYLNLYVGGSIQVAKVVFEGGGSGFEFDNLTISSDTQTPAASMVKISEKVSQAPLVPVSSSVGSVAAPTKVHTGTVPTSPKSGSTVSLFGANFGGVTEVFVAGTKVSIISTSPNQVKIRLPRGLTGEVDVELRSPLGTLKLAKHFNFGGKASSGARSAEVIVGGFDHNSRKLTARMKARIDRWLDRNSDLSKLTCTGFTSLPRRTTDVRLSTNRGTTACEYAKSKRPSITTSVSQGIEDPRPGSNVRRVRLVLTQ
jgi:hypothetical protein